MKTVGYIRVSTDQQGVDGLGMEAQKRAIFAHAKGEVVIFSDVTSGATPVEKRPGLTAAIASLAKGDRLVVAKRDRLGRDVMLVAMVERLVTRRGAAIMSAAGEGNGCSPSDSLMKTMIDAFAEYERQIIRSRTKTALEVKRAKRERYSSTIPYGLTLAADGVHLIPAPKEQNMLQLVEALRSKGESYSAIARELEARGYVPKGKKWYPQTIKNMLLKKAA